MNCSYSGEVLELHTLERRPSKSALLAWDIQRKNIQYPQQKIGQNIVLKLLCKQSKQLRSGEQTFMTRDKNLIIENVDHFQHLFLDELLSGPLHCLQA